MVKKRSQSPINGEKSLRFVDLEEVAWQMTSPKRLYSKVES